MDLPVQLVLIYSWFYCQVQILFRGTISLWYNGTISWGVLYKNRPLDCQLHDMYPETLRKQLF